MNHQLPISDVIEAVDCAKQNLMATSNELREKAQGATDFDSSRALLHTSEMFGQGADKMEALLTKLHETHEAGFDYLHGLADW